MSDKNLSLPDDLKTEINEELKAIKIWPKILFLFLVLALQIPLATAIANLDRPNPILILCYVVVLILEVIFVYHYGVLKKRLYGDKNSSAKDFCNLSDEEKQQLKMSFKAAVKYSQWFYLLIAAFYLYYSGTLYFYHYIYTSWKYNDGIGMGTCIYLMLVAISIIVMGLINLPVIISSSIIEKKLLSICPAIKILKILKLVVLPLIIIASIIGIYGVFSDLS